MPHYGKTDYNKKGDMKYGKEDPSKMDYDKKSASKDNTKRSYSKSSAKESNPGYKRAMKIREAAKKKRSAKSNSKGMY